MADAIKVPAHVRPYVDALGLQLAARFLMEFGGSVGYLSVNPRQDAEIARFLGRDMTIALARSVGEGPVAFPTARPFLAKVLRDNGLNNQQIARRLSVTYRTVRSWLNGDDPNQMSLFS